MRTVAAIPAVSLLAGCASGLLFSPPVSVCIALAVAAAAAAVFSWRTARRFAVPAAACVAFAAGGAAIASHDWIGATHSTLRALFDRTAADDFSIYGTIAGILRSDASVSANGVSVVIDVDRITVDGTTHAVKGGVLITVNGTLAADRLHDWRAGRAIRLPATLRRPSTYLDPGVPDRERVLARQGIVLVGTAKSGALVEVLARGSIQAEAAAALRARVRSTIAWAVAPWSARSAAIVTAIVIGDRAGLDADIQRALQEAGTYHVIAISGGNIAILAGVLLAAFRLGGVLGRSAMIVAAIGLVAYGYLVGGGASVDRATLMAVVYFGTRAWDHRTAPLNTLALVAAILVAIDPLTIADPAFVLTFGATLGILVVMPVVASRRRSRVVSAVLALLAASVAAEVMLFPVTAAVFSRITVAGLALNFLAIPLMAVAQLAGMALVPVALVSKFAAIAVGWIAHVGAAGLVWSAQLVRFVQIATWRVPAPSPLAMIIYYAAVATAWGCARRDIRLAAIVSAAAAGIWMAAVPWAFVAGRGDGRLHVTFVDVGQGDATAIRFPHGATWMVDAGGLSSGSGFDVGDRVVAPVLRTMGVRRLAGMVLTHGDPDHVGGAAALVREFRPRTVWEGVPVPKLDLLVRVAGEARAVGAAWKSVHAGDSIDIDGVSIAVRHPPPPEWERQRVRNDDSVVIELRWRDVSILLTGDIGSPVEPAVAAALTPAPIRIVKAPHHGSGSSSSAALIEGAHPAIAVISVGRGNHFGHPAPAVIGRYLAAGAEIVRTDKDGAIFVETDGGSITINTFTGRHVTLCGSTVHEGPKGPTGAKEMIR